MSTNTLSLGFVPGGTTSIANREGGLLGRLFARLVEARMRQGEAHVAAALARMGDRQLADLGFDAGEIAQIRASGRIPESHWAR